MTEKYWTAKLGSRFRVTIPKQALKAMGITPPATVVFRTEEDGRVRIFQAPEGKSPDNRPSSRQLRSRLKALMSIS